VSKPHKTSSCTHVHPYIPSAGIAGTSVAAAEVLADAAVDAQKPQGCIYVSDVAMQVRLPPPLLGSPARCAFGWFLLGQKASEHVRPQRPHIEACRHVVLCIAPF